MFTRTSSRGLGSFFILKGGEDMYKVLKKIILNGNYDKVDISKKADMFYAKNRITAEEYEELLTLMETN